MAKFMGESKVLQSFSTCYFVTRILRDRSCSSREMVPYAVDSIVAVDTLSLSCRAGSTDIPDPLSPLFPIVHRLRQVFWTASRIHT